MDKQIKARQIKIVPIGNSQGIRLLKAVLLRKQEDEKKLSWADTYKAMSKEQEDWSDFDAVSADGLEKNS